MFNRKRAAGGARLLLALLLLSATAFAGTVGVTPVPDASVWSSSNNFSTFYASTTVGPQSFLTDSTQGLMVQNVGARPTPLPGGPVNFYTLGGSSGVYVQPIQLAGVNLSSELSFETVQLRTVFVVSSPDYGYTNFTDNRSYWVGLDPYLAAVADTPEPSTLALIGLGLVGIAVGMGRRREE
ncbi:MAG: PEP-CTERM sorting domain-containing protein [Acidobacteria bacterium]|nr:PEP-CTERM sorting domain-containing protein [Acidobacteriota bacterium]